MGGPVVPDEESTTPPDGGPGRDAVRADARGDGASRRELDPVPPASAARRTGRPRPPAPRFCQQRRQAGRARRPAVAGSSGATHRPAATAPSTAAAQDSGSAIDTATVVPGANGPRAKARRHRSSDAKLRTRSLRASSAYTRSPSAAARRETSAPRHSPTGATPIPETTDPPRARPGPDASPSGPAPPCQYIIRGSE